MTGTLPECLDDALAKRYADLGLESTFRLFSSIDQLADADVNLAVVKDHFLADHCIAVLEVTSDYVVVGDPVRGREIIPRSKFADVWRFCGIALNRPPVLSDVEGLTRRLATQTTASNLVF